MINEITVEEFATSIKNGEDFQLIDVREPYEFDEMNMNGILIPMGDIPYNWQKIDRNKKVVVHCRSGARSANVIAYLQEKHGFNNLFNLKGGILAWNQLNSKG